jgi:hypothetical protein
VASIIAAAAGVVLMFGRSVMSFGRNVFRRIWPGSRRKPASSVSLPPDMPGESPEV